MIPKGRKRWIGLGVLALVVIAVAVAVSRRGEDPIAVEAAEVKRGDVILKVIASGKVQPEAQVKISAYVSGRIEALGVKEGAEVAEGDFLVQLDRTRYQAAADQSRASVSSAGAEARLAAANLEQAQRTLARQRELEERGLSSESQLDAAGTEVKVQQATLEAARDRVAQARAALDQAQDDLAKTTIDSPMAGVVSQLNSEVGEMVLGTSQFEGTTIMTVADLSRMEVEVEVDENDIVQVCVSDTAIIEVDALPDTSFRGVVTEIANTAITRGLGTQEEITHFPVRIAFAETSADLRPGMSAGVEIVCDVREDVLQIPIQSVTLRELPARDDGAGDDERGGEGLVAEARADADTEAAGVAEPESSAVEVVFVVSDSRVELRRLETGLTGEANLEVLSGLDAGERIVVGSYRALSRELEDGSRIEVE